jgi:hypothetical protein
MGMISWFPFFTNRTGVVEDTKQAEALASSPDGHDQAVGAIFIGFTHLVDDFNIPCPHPGSLVQARGDQPDPKTKQEQKDQVKGYQSSSMT